MVAVMPAPRFYVNADEAMQQYYYYKKGRSCIRGIERRKMYAEIFIRFERKMELLKATGQRAIKIDTMESILTQEAPSFYYSSKSAAVVFYRTQLEKRRSKRL